MLPPVYPIVDVDLCRLRGVDPRALARACVDGGARLLQIRQKAPGTGAFVSLTRSIVEDGASRGVLVIVNDRADVAAMAGAAGVHVGQQDLPVPAVRAIAGADAIIGLSTHTTGQIDAALATDVDYIAVGPIFRTSTKDTGYEPRGLEMVTYAANGRRPVVAIGGVTIDNAASVLAAGASSVAVISDVLSSASAEQRVRDYLRALADAD